MFKFLVVEQANMALLTGWSIDSYPVILKKWDPTFNENSENMGSFPIWVRFQGLPPLYWYTKVFQAIEIC
jgi:hypothetical protein